MRSYFILVPVVVSLLCFSLPAHAQAPAIEWQKSIGGSGSESPNAIAQTTDGGYIIAGFGSSSDGDAEGNDWTLGDNYWIVKVDGTGRVEWQKSLGGSGSDWANTIQQTKDGGYIVVGYSSSTDGVVTGHHGSSANSDGWIVKLNDTGKIDWEKSLGGTSDEQINSLQQTADGGYIIAGFSSSNNGDVTGNHGGMDYWIVKLDDTGKLQWQKSLGGSVDDIAYSARQTKDGGYIVAGTAKSSNGNVTGHHGSTAQDDAWVVKLDDTGKVVWEKSYGGSQWDVAYTLEVTTDGGYVIAGASASNDGDVSGHHGLAAYVDMWVVKLNDTGAIDWQKSLGGSWDENATSIKQTSEGGYIVAGFTFATDGDVTKNHGSADAWIVKLDEAGGMQWQESLGGSSLDMATAVEETKDKGFIVAVGSYSTDGDITGHHDDNSYNDYWIVKLEPENSEVMRRSTPSLSVSNYPNPFSRSTMICVPGNETASVRITDALGRCVAELHPDSSGLCSWTPTATIPSGNYYITAYTSLGTVISSTCFAR